MLEGCAPLAYIAGQLRNAAENGQVESGIA